MQVHSLWQPVSGRFKNYIHQPKPNGYRSLHDVVTASDGMPMEIQARPWWHRPSRVTRLELHCKRQRCEGAG